MRTPPSLFGMATMALEYGDVECRIIPAARYWSLTASAFLERMGLILGNR